MINLLPPFFFNHCYALVIMFLNWVTSHNSALQKLGFRANDILFWFTFVHSVRKRRKAQKIRGNLVTNSVFYSNVYSFDLVWFLFFFLNDWTWFPGFQVSRSWCYSSDKKGQFQALQLSFVVPNLWSGFPDLHKLLTLLGQKIYVCFAIFSLFLNYH